MPQQTIQSYQIRVYMNAREIGLKQSDAAFIAEFSERTGQRIDAGEHQPNRGRVRDWRTSADPLAGVWEEELEPMLQREPRLKPMTLFEYLQERYPGQYPQVLRTLQRRVRTWKVLQGEAPEVMFELRHEPGVMGISDFTELKGMTITIKGHPFEHLLYHYRLAYSGWRYAQVIQGGESFIALSEGLQNALLASGGAPQQHRTDSLSAAYRNTGGKGRKPLTRLYDDLCHHYRLQPTRNNKGIAHENGAIESPHGHLKNRITQALYLRGSNDFESVAAYQAFIETSVAKLNQQHQTKFAEEQPHLQSLPKHRVADYEILTARVSSRSTIDVRCILYTVPSRLIGRQLELHLYHDRICGYLERQLVVELPRIRVTAKDKRRARCINYRHVVEGLRRKPRAFIYCTWQAELLPNDHYRQLWQQLQTTFELDSAAVLMVEALFIAATQNKETAVAAYLEAQWQAGTLTLAGLRRHFQLLKATAMPSVTVQQHNLDDYDQLFTDAQPSGPIQSHESLKPTPPTESLSEPQPSSQAAAPGSYAPALGDAGTSSPPRKMDLCSVLASTLRIGGRPTLERPPQTRSPRSPTPRRQNGCQLRVEPPPKP
ncbi:MAG: IS21 family transposase [Cyanobacteria bacterium P01_D01_bin.56]